MRKNIFPKYHLICLDRFDNEVHEAVDEWIYMLKNSRVKSSFRSKHILTAAKKLRLMSMGREEQQAYLEYMGRKAEEIDTLQTAYSYGKREAALEIAQNLQGVLSEEEIAQRTGLSLGEAQALIN